MAQKGVQLDEETFSCPICLDLLKDPVTIPCGHSYCLNCIKRYWGEEDEEKRESCPQCRQSFTPRPVLVKNTMLAALVEELKKTGLQPAAAVYCSAGPKDVACDVCTERKLKALKSCLQCLASYCEKHLQPHYEAAPLKRHKLVEPCKNLQVNVCCRHNEVMKMFCRTDQRCICYLCSVEAHKGHDTVSAAAEKAERQRELEGSRQRIQQGIQDREKDVKVLQQEVEALNHSAEKTVEDSEKVFTDLIRHIEKMSSEVKQKIRSQQETEVRRIKELQMKLDREITELKRKDAELEQLSHTEDHIQFLQRSMPGLCELTDSPRIKLRRLSYFKDVTVPLSALRHQLQAILGESWTNMSSLVTEVDVLLSDPQAGPRTRAGFLKYSHEIRLDPNTAHSMVVLCEEGRAAELTTKEQLYSSHPARFTRYYQVLSRESLTGRCYWEVKWRGGGVGVAVTYKSICRAGSGNESMFGFNDKSWALFCYQNGYEMWNKNIQIPVSGPKSSRIGVYLDHRAGILSFYSVSETMTLLHRVQTTFTEPVHAGLRFSHHKAFAEFCKIKTRSEPLLPLAEGRQPFVCGPL